MTRYDRLALWTLLLAAALGVAGLGRWVWSLF